MKKQNAILALGLSLLLQACAIEGSHRFSTTGVRVSNAVALGTEAYHNCEEQRYNTHYEYNNYPVQQDEYIIGPQYYKLSVPIPGQYRNIKNYMNAPVVAETSCGSSVIIPRSWN
jgi:hypothetical protein